jgi:Flp pilus assembly protein TadG
MTAASRPTSRAISFAKGATRQRRIDSARRGDVGSLTVFVAVLALALFALIGLVVDGGRAVAAQSAVTGEAEQAARVGADQISVQAIRSGTVAIDPLAAAKAASAYLQAAGTSGVVTISGQNVRVHIQSSEPTVILGIVGVVQIGLSATASATNVHGVTRADS